MVDDSDITLTTQEQDETSTEEKRVHTENRRIASRKKETSAKVNEKLILAKETSVFIPICLWQQDS